MGNYKDQDPNKAPPLTSDAILKAAEQMEAKPDYVWYSYINFGIKQRLRASINGYEDDQPITEDF